MAGGLTAQKGVSKFGGKVISRVKEKLMSKFKIKFGIYLKILKKNQMRIMNQKQILILTLTSLTFQVKVNLIFLKVIIITCLYIPQINQGLLNQTERNEGNQQGGVDEVPNNYSCKTLEDAVFGPSCRGFYS